MSSDDPRRHVLVAYDGSPPAVAAIEVGATLLPGARATVLHLWTPPFASEPLRRRLRERAGSAEELVELLEREGAAEAQRLVATGCVLAEAAGWPSTPLVRRSFGGDGIRFAAVAESERPDLALIGSRGLAGFDAAMGSFTELVLQHSAIPVLAVPCPLLSDDRAQVATGPVVVGWDGSEGAGRALDRGAATFPGRELVAVTVDAAGQQADDPARGAGPDTAGRRTGARHVTLPAATRTAVRPAVATARALIRAAREQRACAVVVGSRGRSAWRETLLGSTAIEVLRHADLPVMVVGSVTGQHDGQHTNSEERTTP